MDPYVMLGVVICGLIVAALVFILCREILCWYWKINEAVTLLRGIDASLQRIAQSQPAPAYPPQNDFSSAHRG